MWTRSYSKIYQGIRKEDVWRLWSDVNQWHLWDPDIEYGRMSAPFLTGNSFVFKPKGMSEVTLHLVEVEPFHKYLGQVGCPRYCEHLAPTNGRIDKARQTW
jgi:hypothetical protein